MKSIIQQYKSLKNQLDLAKTNHNIRIGMMKIATAQRKMFKQQLYDLKKINWEHNIEADYSAFKDLIEFQTERISVFNKALFESAAHVDQLKADL